MAGAIDTSERCPIVPFQELRKELLEPVGVGITQDLPGRTFLDDSSGSHEDDAVGDPRSGRTGGLQTGTANDGRVQLSNAGRASTLRMVVSLMREPHNPVGAGVAS